jgi:hypothetical protein
MNVVGCYIAGYSEARQRTPKGRGDPTSDLTSALVSTWMSLNLLVMFWREDQKSR